MLRIQRIIASTAALLIVACDSDYSEQVDNLSHFVEGQQLGLAPDIWLEQKSRVVDEWDRVALVFGYMQDFEACTRIAEFLARTDERHYRCVPAN
jgi:siroheme synthase (precorrin-2 oxidase/ferrochelatase)